jgi:murein DD-endopeptidase MepM/ murein hydrolase activator NlpD
VKKTAAFLSSLPLLLAACDPQAPAPDRDAPVAAAAAEQHPAGPTDAAGLPVADDDAGESDHAHALPPAAAPLPDEPEAASFPPNLGKRVFAAGSPCVAAKVAPPAGSSCCSYWIRNQSAAKDERYEQPYHAFGLDAAAAETFAAGVRVKMPFFEPFTEPRAKAVGAWYYDSGGFHAAMDYMKDSLASGENPTFEVRASAPGKVLSAIWDNWMGNVVIIEHTAPDGSKYRTLYAHLRNGKSNDVAAARAVPVPADAKADSNVVKYSKFANKAVADELYWGTDAQTLQVKAGDSVAQGQLLGWVGNTGPGGAGNGLDLNGNVTNTAYGNVHLHTFFAVPNPNNSAKWVFVDPYGVYNQVNTGCYALLKDPQHRRLYAVFPPSFHNVSSALVSKYFGYYPGMGMALQTLSLHRSGSSVLASGSFQSGLPAQWRALFYATPADFQAAFDDAHKDGLRPREVSVTLDGSGTPRYTAIWKARGGEGYFTWMAMDDATFSAKWDDLIKTQGYRIEDHFVYSLGGKRTHAAVFVNDGVHDWKAPYSYTPADYQTFFNDAYGDGYVQTSLNMEELPAGLRAGGVFLKKPGSWPVRFGLSAAGYQQKFNELGALGYRLYKLQGYANSTQFAAIWTR